MSVYRSILAIGDSITYGYPEGPSWTQVAGRLLGINIHNAGLNGDTLAGIYSRLESNLSRHKPDACLVMGGTNDVYQGLPFSRLRENTQRIDSRLREEKIQPIWGLPLPLLFADLEQRLEQYRDWLRDWAEFSIPFYEVFRDENGFRADLLPDGCHPSPEGYRLMGELAAKRLGVG